MNIKWVYKKFEALNAKELYAILDLRNEVFVVEQNCAYNDTDGKDFESHHLCGFIENKLVAYCRIIPPGVAFTECSIGRVVTSPECRKNGFGILLMKEAIEKCKNEFNNATLKIGAQLYLKTFYANLGFTQSSDVYLEDGIQHIEMVLIK